jgi:hypothetical protein
MSVGVDVATKTSGAGETPVGVFGVGPTTAENEHALDHGPMRPRRSKNRIRQK